MNAQELVSEVWKRGASFGLDRRGIYVEPASAVPQDLFEELRAHRSELRAFLDDPPTPDELIYPLEYVRREVSQFTPPYRDEYERWRGMLEANGYTPEQAERSAYRHLVVLSGPLPLRRWSYVCAPCRAEKSLRYRPRERPRCSDCGAPMEARG